MRKTAVLLSLILAACLLLIAAWAWPGSGACSFADNAAWAGTEWASSPSGDQAVEDLASLHASHRIHDIYVYAAYLKPDGQFSSAAEYLPGFAAAYCRANPGSRVLAWVGVPLANQHGIGIDGWVDLSDPTTRYQIVMYIAGVIRDGDLDGVHLNAETVWDGDMNYLLLLQEIRAVLKPDQILSIAGSYWMPPALVWLPVIGDFRWSTAYYSRVGETVDQVAVMAYDSHLPAGSLYRLWVREETRGIYRSLAGTNAQVVIGVSASKEANLSHRPDAETLANGLAGICDGYEALTTGNENGNPSVGIYASWEASPLDWNMIK